MARLGPNHGGRREGSGRKPLYSDKEMARFSNMLSKTTYREFYSETGVTPSVVTYWRRKNGIAVRDSR